jgi:hypothetical protein
LTEAGETPAVPAAPARFAAVFAAVFFARALGLGDAVVRDFFAAALALRAFGFVVIRLTVFRLVVPISPCPFQL